LWYIPKKNWIHHVSRRDFGASGGFGLQKLSVLPAISRIFFAAFHTYFIFSVQALIYDKPVVMV